MEDQEVNKLNHLPPTDNHSLWVQPCSLRKGSIGQGGESLSQFQVIGQQSGIFSMFRDCGSGAGADGTERSIEREEQGKGEEELTESVVGFGAQMHAGSALPSRPSLAPKLATVTVIYEAPGKNKRGRKPLRPQDPIRRKTEEKDKYWLRAFRAYMQKRFNEEKKSMTLEDRFFWREYLGPEGKPDKGNPYLSYGQKYKDYLFGHQTFTTHFRDWFYEKGEEALERKYQKSSDLWFVYYDYALKELLSYTSKS